MPRVPRLLSGLLICSQCGSRYVLRGRRTYGCATRQNRGRIVCDCNATVNAVEAEQAVLDLLEPLFCDPAVLAKLEAAVRRRFVSARRRRSEPKGLEGQLTAELAEVEAQIGRLVQWIAKGRLVEDLEAQMAAAEARRDHLRHELSRAQAAEPPTGIDVLPTAVRKIVSDLRGMLRAGRVEDLKRVLSRLMTSIEVHEDQRPGRKRPGAKLVVRGNLEAMLQLTGKVTTGNSPGGILPPLTFQLPPRVIGLRRRGYPSDGCRNEQARLAGGVPNLSRLQVGPRGCRSSAVGGPSDCESTQPLSKMVRSQVWGGERPVNTAIHCDLDTCRPTGRDNSQGLRHPH